MDKILVVDDAKDIITLMEYDLDDEGYEVIHATSGEQALGRLGSERPDLIP